jgi:hypothetical protein
MKKKTAVQKLIERIKLKDKNLYWELSDELEEAKAIENEQMEYMFECGRNFQLTGEGTFTQVHNETYGKNP